jgi:AdoMet-dependent heme synthase
MGTKHQGTPRKKKMLLSHIEKSLRDFPGVNSYYLKNYSKFRRNLFKTARLLPALKFPRYVHLLVTLDCNFSCAQCQVDARKREETQLTFDELARLIGDIANAGVRHLIVTGGEPLTRPDIFDILRCAGETGIPLITLATNGYLVERYRQELAGLRIDRVVTSIDDVGQRNDAIRGKRGAFERALTALDIFREIGVQERIVNTTVFPGNISRLEDLAPHVAASSATGWVVGLLIPTGRAQSLEKRFFGDSEISALFDLIKRLRVSVPIELNSHTGCLQKCYRDITTEPFYCRAGVETCSITPWGEVLPCNIVCDDRFSEGNVRDRRFDTIWKEGFGEFRNPVYPEMCRSCEFLAACGGGCWGYRVLGEKYCYKKFRR